MSRLGVHSSRVGEAEPTAGALSALPERDLGTISPVASARSSECTQRLDHEAERSRLERSVDPTSVRELGYHQAQRADCGARSKSARGNATQPAALHHTHTHTHTHTRARARARARAPVRSGSASRAHRSRRPWRARPVRAARGPSGGSAQRGSAQPPRRQARCGSRPGTKFRAPPRRPGSGS